MSATRVRLSNLSVPCAGDRVLCRKYGYGRVDRVLGFIIFVLFDSGLEQAYSIDAAYGFLSPAPDQMMLSV